MSIAIAIDGPAGAGKSTIARLAAKGKIPATRDDFLECCDPVWRPLERCRERDEALEKLVKMGLVRE